MAYGTVNADVIGTSVAGSNLGAGNASIMKNRIINGAMVIDQRNAGASITPASAAYLLDRYQFFSSQSSKFTVQQNAGSVTPPAGFTNYMGFTVASAVTIGSGDYFYFKQAIEGYNFADMGWGTANAKTITLSFQVRSSLTGTFGGALFNSAGTRSYPFSYTISAANTWTTISVTIAGDTGGGTDWLTTNGIGVNVVFNLGTGSTYTTTGGAWTAGTYVAPTGAVSVVGTAGATFYITGVQLEVGSSATGYEYRQYTTELALCQRYFSLYAQGNGSSQQTIGTGMMFGPSQAEYVVPFKVTMRTAPSMYVSNVSNSFAINNSGYDTTTSTWSIFGATPNSALIFGTPASNGTNGLGVRISVGSSSSSSTYLGFSAEL